MSAGAAFMGRRPPWEKQEEKSVSASGGGWITLVVSVLVVLGIMELVRRLTMRRLARRWPTAAAELRPCTVPAFTTAALIAVRSTLFSGMLPAKVDGGVRHVVSLALIAAVTWLCVQMIYGASDLYLSALTAAEQRGARDAQRAKTQVTMVRRTAGSIIVVIGIGALLFTFPAVRSLGTGVMASAGFIGIVAGIAAQPTLGNLFAGLQLAFSDALRIDDIVVVQDQWGRIEQLTLTYVVVRTWDERRLVMPVSYFTQTPFENWTKNGGELQGTVLLHVDWSLPVAELRSCVHDWLAEHPLWDGRNWSFEVIDVLDNGLVELRAVVSAANSANLWTLRCDLREWLVETVRDNYPQALPRLRAAFSDGASNARGDSRSAFVVPPGARK